MKKNKQKNALWIGGKDLNREPEFIEEAGNEFRPLPIVESLGQEGLMEGMKSSRRDFLKYLGFGLGAAAVASGCDIPVKRAIPYAVKPDTIVPGVPVYYASSYVDGGDYCSVLVKTREGRPIKIEGNSLSKINMGGTSSRAQASVLTLYDTARFKGPGMLDKGKFGSMSWKELDKIVTEKLATSGNVKILSKSVISPSRKKVINAFCEKFNAQHIVCDPVSSSALLQANEESFGVKAVPDYHFDKAEFIVSFGADFLGTWISPVEYTAKYAKGRKIKDFHHAKMSRHIQVESNMSLSGSNADNRILVKPSEQGAAILSLYNEVAMLSGKGTINGPKPNEKAAASLKKLAKDLTAARGGCLVVSGTNNKAEQLLINGINEMLGSYGHTMDFDHPSYQRQGVDSDMATLLDEMSSGQVDMLFVLDANPVYDLPYGKAFADAMKKTGMTVSFAGKSNETVENCNYVAPANNILESWGDAEPKAGFVSLIQPTINPLFKTRQVECSLLTWSEDPLFDPAAEQPFYAYLQNFWKEQYYGKQNKYSDFQSFWNMTLHDGVFEYSPEVSSPSAFSADLSNLGAGVSKPSGAELEIQFYEHVHVGSGQHADNPYLQEVPEPVTRCTWGNYLAIPVAWDGDRTISGFKGIEDGDLVMLGLGDNEHRVPAIRQFGQMPGTVALAVGYGRKEAGLAARGIGVDMYPYCRPDADGNIQYFTDCSVSEPVGKEEHFSCVQYHHTMGVTGTDANSGEEINVDEQSIVDDAFKSIAKGMQGSLTDRSIIFRGNVADAEELIHHVEHEREHFAHLNEQTLYPEQSKLKEGHHWGMHVDLNACTGCNACVVACNTENNIPVVGKKEVSRHHEMTWLRIDRYFYGDFENPNAVYQPMLCQHCDNAPCENVCPVNATNHSSEGLNQMAYNRCVGTRYCANNCPYKVRRFNWLDYAKADLFPANEPLINGEEIPFGADNLTRMILNPDVTVRSRGVIEKCSFCVQRLQDGKLRAKKEGRGLLDSDVKSACQTACPTNAITMGDMNNPGGDLSKMIEKTIDVYSFRGSQYQTFCTLYGNTE